CWLTRTTLDTMTGTVTREAGQARTSSTVQARVLRPTLKNRIPRGRISPCRACEIFIFIFASSIKLCSSLGLQVLLVRPLFQFPEAKHGDACSYYYFYHKLQSGVQVYKIILALLSILKYGYASADSFHVRAAVRA